ncbi:DUF523 domain-containing protein [Paenibacillus thailandensis]|uniref:DUF523 domain-containing protein n=1 Tax=Paenibacillus thailandensis TaxID=393250 RepID=A0ABW5R468_9BACL
MIIVSSCLAGFEVRYNGSHRLDRTVRKLLEEGKAAAVCPELMGGLPTPREAAEIVGGGGEDVLDGTAKVMDRLGNDVTELYVKGAYEALETARRLNATLIVLKEDSPSCGSASVYDGTFSGRKVDGGGVTTALLRRNGFKVISERELPAHLAELA